MRAELIAMRRVADMVAMRREGLTLREIGAKHGISKQRVSILLSRDAAEQHTAESERHNITDMVALRRAGLTFQEIGAKHGISRQMATYLLNKHGPSDLERQALEAQRQAREVATQRRPQWRDARGRPLFPKISRR
jgi:DNA-binding CsgD family transcriptional regulator